MKSMTRYFFLFFLLLSTATLADDGSRLWLNYDLIKDAKQRESYAPFIKFIAVASDNQTLKIASEELKLGLQGLLGKKIATVKTATTSGGIILNVNKNAPSSADISNEGYEIYTEKGNIIISSKSETGVLYGAFELLRAIQTGVSLAKLSVTSSPKVKIRMLNHWDNANGTVERGYAGSSMWKWNELPHRVDPRYVMYARANASIGINATSINNVNASSRFLTAEYLEKSKPLPMYFAPTASKFLFRSTSVLPVPSADSRPPTRSTPKCVNGGTTKPKRFTNTFQILVGIWSKPIRKVNLARRITAYPRRRRQHASRSHASVQRHRYLAGICIQCRPQRRPFQGGLRSIQTSRRYIRP